jgi:hypothetical protein
LGWSADVTAVVVVLAVVLLLLQTAGDLSGAKSAAAVKRGVIALAKVMRLDVIMSSRRSMHQLFVPREKIARRKFDLFEVVGSVFEERGFAGEGMTRTLSSRPNA